MTLAIKKTHNEQPMKINPPGDRLGSKSGRRTMVGSDKSRNKSRPPADKSQTKPSHSRSSDDNFPLGATASAPAPVVSGLSTAAGSDWAICSCRPKCTSTNPGASKINSNKSRLRTLHKRLNLKNRPIISRDDT